MDELQKLYFPRANVRGQTVAIHESLQAALAAQDLPAAAKRFAGEAACATLLAAAALQFDGAVLLQIEGDGPVRLLVVEVRPDSGYRVMVKMRDDFVAGSLADDASMQTLVNASGRGRCALILDMRGRSRDEQPYQGVVALEGKNLGEALEAYFRQSEQVETVIRLAADDKAAGGVMLQKMPVTGGKDIEDYDPEGWNRLKLFVDTVKADELLTLSPEDVNRRLFWEESPLVVGQATPQFRCACSDERFAAIVRSLGREEVESILAERGQVEIACRFCGRKKVFDKIDVEAIFAGASGAPAQA